MPLVLRGVPIVNTHSTNEAVLISNDSRFLVPSVVDGRKGCAPLVINVFIQDSAERLNLVPPELIRNCIRP